MAFLSRAFVFASAALLAQDQLPPWTPGVLEIHQISTGRGNSAFSIFPDGTTMLVDAGAVAAGQIPETDAHPDSTLTTGSAIARYIKRRLPAAASALDYALITHFHIDHMGQITAATPKDPTGAYRLAGITEVDQSLPFRTLIDRGWPNYDYPAALKDETVANYRQFIETRRKGGLTVERFQPGSATQIRLRGNGERYPQFRVRNILANGELWTGAGDSTRQLFPPVAGLAPADLPTENMCSLGLRVEYGNFRYFTGGDLPGEADPGFPEWHAVEPAIASVIGKVDVHVVNHHGSPGVETAAFLAALQSTVIVIPAWAPSHPGPDVLKRIMNNRYPPSPRYVFATDMRESARTVIGQRATQHAGPVGHIVVRVEPGGAQYAVYVVDNRDEKGTVLAVKGPFKATGLPNR